MKSGNDRHDTISVSSDRYPQSGLLETIWGLPNHIYKLTPGQLNYKKFKYIGYNLIYKTAKKD